VDYNLIRINKKVVIFFICLVIATFFWFLSNLSKEYNAQVKVPLQYINFPKDKVVSNKLPSEINLYVKASGFTLLLFRFKDKLDPVVVDGFYVRPYKTNEYFYFAANSRLEAWTEAFGDRMKILQVFPDTLFFNFSEKSTKSVPVKANISYDFEKEYDLKDGIKVVPSSINISGARNLIAKIDHVETEKISLHGLNKPTHHKARIIITPQLKQVDLSQKEVEINLPVAKFTEGSVEVPLQVRNLPAGASIKTFPDKVTVKYLVPLENYERIKPLMFMVVADYSKVKKENTFMKLELILSPKNVKGIKLIPEKVEYLIRK
jgi:hypothetical protein